jgi:hypothetical protein
MGYLGIEIRAAFADASRARILGHPIPTDDPNHPPATPHHRTVRTR